jgi:hypothetical protein
VSVKPSACKQRIGEFVAGNIELLLTKGWDWNSVEASKSFVEVTHHDHLIHSHTPLKN